MLISGWCGQHGRPNHSGCRGERCDCYCHLSTGKPQSSTTRSASRISKRGKENDLPPVDAHFPPSAPSLTIEVKETTNASRPRTKGVGAPVQGLADRLETTDS